MKLEDFFINNPKAAIAFSGGVDSAYLLYAAKTYGKEVKAYYAASELMFEPILLTDAITAKNEYSLLLLKRLLRMVFLLYWTNQMLRMTQTTVLVCEC